MLGSSDGCKKLTGLSSHCANSPPDYLLPKPASLMLVAFGIRFMSRIIAKEKDTLLGVLLFWCARRDLNPHVRNAH